MATGGAVPEIVTATASGARKRGDAKKMKEIIEQNDKLKKIAEGLEQEYNDIQRAEEEGAEQADVEKMKARFENDMAQYEQDVLDAWDRREAEIKLKKALEEEVGFREIEEQQIPEEPATTQEKVLEKLEGRAVEREVTGAPPTAMEAAFKKAKVQKEDRASIKVREAQSKVIETGKKLRNEQRNATETFERVQDEVAKAKERGASEEEISALFDKYDEAKAKRDKADKAHGIALEERSKLGVEGIKEDYGIPIEKA